MEDFAYICTYLGLEHEIHVNGFFVGRARRPIWNDSWYPRFNDSGEWPLLKVMLNWNRGLT